jgi:hypothetical protein
VDQLHEEATRLLAGAAGSLAFTFLRPDRESWSRCLCGWGVGTMVAYWMTPPLCQHEGWGSETCHSAAFVIGLLGVVTCKVVIDTVEGSAASEIAAWLLRTIRRIFGQAPPLPEQDNRGRPRREKAETKRVRNPPLPAPETNTVKNPPTPPPFRPPPSQGDSHGSL